MTGIGNISPDTAGSFSGQCIIYLRRIRINRASVSDKTYPKAPYIILFCRTIKLNRQQAGVNALKPVKNRLF
jgi:hypothetical protein